jgi:hypothetical protein
MNSLNLYHILRIYPNFIFIFTLLALIEKKIASNSIQEIMQDIEDKHFKEQVGAPTPTFSHTFWCILSSSSLLRPVLSPLPHSLHSFPSLLALFPLTPPLTPPLSLRAVLYARKASSRRRCAHSHIAGRRAAAGVGPPDHHREGALEPLRPYPPTACQVHRSAAIHSHPAPR